MRPQRKNAKEKANFRWLHEVLICEKERPPNFLFYLFSFLSTYMRITSNNFHINTFNFAMAALVRKVFVRLSASWSNFANLAACIGEASPPLLAFPSPPLEGATRGTAAASNAQNFNDFECISARAFNCCRSNSSNSSSLPFLRVNKNGRFGFLQYLQIVSWACWLWLRSSGSVFVNSSIAVSVHSIAAPQSNWCWYARKTSLQERFFFF